MGLVRDPEIPETGGRRIDSGHRPGFFSLVPEPIYRLGHLPFLVVQEGCEYLMTRCAFVVRNN